MIADREPIRPLGGAWAASAEALNLAEASIPFENALHRVTQMPVPLHLRRGVANQLRRIVAAALAVLDRPEFQQLPPLPATESRSNTPRLSTH